jgi:hypothetical protein
VNDCPSTLLQSVNTTGVTIVPAGKALRIRERTGGETTAIGFDWPVPLGGDGAH